MSNLFVFSQLFDRNPIARLGAPNSPYGAIRAHSFFMSIDWHRLEKAEVTPPFLPQVVSQKYFCKTLS